MLAITSAVKSIGLHSIARVAGALKARDEVGTVLAAATITVLALVNVCWISETQASTIVVSVMRL